MALNDAEDHGIVNGGSRVLLGVDDSTAATEVIYLRNLLENMGLAQKSPTPVFEDNTACIEWGNHVIGGRERAKHRHQEALRA